MSLDGPSRAGRLRLVVFTLIGVFNTLFDVAFYTLLRTLGQPVVVANLVSATVALLGSYLLNSRLTFKSAVWSPTKFAAFVAVTLSGLWFLQTGAIYGLSHLLRVVPEHYWRHLGSGERLGKLVAPKLLATGVTFVWNYTWYNRVIFRPASPAAPDAASRERAPAPVGADTWG